jgi:formylglycine-generating enzyme required for sulfatase activity
MSDGWAWVRSEQVRAPLYWEAEGDARTTVFGLSGRRPLSDDESVSNVSWYEADAYARWSGHRLPTEQEWETAVTRHPDLVTRRGDVWEWTRSAYGPYPGYRPPPGAIGEYNGKFMANQMVLRGSSVATPPGHARVTYRNFFYPRDRWQFTGVRLADDRR